MAKVPRIYVASPKDSWRAPWAASIPIAETIPTVTTTRKTLAIIASGTTLATTNTRRQYPKP